MAQVTVRIERSRFATKQPAVIIPLKDWEKIEELLEDLEALSSSKYLRRIAHARTQAARGQVVSLEDMLKDFGA